jgi:hypothetical protein
MIVVAAGLAIGGARDVVEATPGSATYTFPELSVEYPYQDPWTGAGDPSRAAVLYTTGWSTSEYPGLAACEFVLEDLAGDVVGTHRFDLSSATSELPHAISSDPIPVSAPPATVDARCDEGSYPSGPGYRFSRPSVGNSAEGRARLRFDVDWQGDVNPAMRSCTVTVMHDDGTTSEYGPFGFQLSASEPFDFDLPGREELRDIRDADVSCSEI